MSSPQTDEDPSIDLADPLTLITENGKLAYAIGRYVQANWCFELVVAGLSIPLDQELGTPEHSIGVAVRQVQDELQKQFAATQWAADRGLPSWVELSSEELDLMYRALQVCVLNRNMFAHAYLVDGGETICGRVSQAMDADVVELDVIWFMEAQKVAMTCAMGLNQLFQKYHFPALMDIALRGAVEDD